MEVQGRSITVPVADVEKIRRRRRYLAVLVCFLFMFLPMIGARMIYAEDFEEIQDEQSAEEANGLGVQSFLVAVAFVVLRGVFLTVFRVLIRSVMRSVFFSTARSTLQTLEDPAEHPHVVEVTHWLQSPIWGLMATWVILLLSFVWVFQLGSTNTSVMVSVWLGAIYIMPALLLQYVIGWWYCNRHRLSYRFSAPPLGVALQLFFAFSHSYLPMTHETEARGADLDHRAAMAEAGLVGLGVLSFVSVVVGFLTGVAEIIHFGFMSTLFFLVNAFPLRPMTGHAVWVVHRKRALAFLIASLALFALSVNGTETVWLGIVGDV